MLLGDCPWIVTCLTSCHAMEVVLLWLDPSQESSIHKPPRSRRGVIRQEGWEGAPTGHEWRALALKLNLPE